MNKRKFYLFGIISDKRILAQSENLLCLMITKPTMFKGKEIPTMFKGKEIPTMFKSYLMTYLPEF